MNQMHCSACGAAAKATCKCGVAYLPAGEFAALAVAASPEKSDRAIAAEIGVSPTTVAKARSQLSNSGQLKRTGRDGKSRRAPSPRARSAPGLRLPRSADDAQAVIAKANADAVKWEARKVEAEARKRAADQAIMSFGGIAADVHHQLVHALDERDYERAEKIRASLGMKWHQLIFPAVEAKAAA